MTQSIARSLILILLLNFAVTTFILLHDFEHGPRDNIEVICLDGVEYWYKNFGVRSALAARFQVNDGEFHLIQCMEPTSP